MSAEQIGQFLPLLLIVVVFWLLILRPARRKQQAALRLQRSLGVGDRVMLTSGLFGTVLSLDDESFECEVAPGVVVTVHRQAVSTVVTKAADEAAPDDAPSDASSRDDGGDVRS